MNNVWVSGWTALTFSLTDRLAKCKLIISWLIEARLNGVMLFHGQINIQNVGNMISWKSLYLPPGRQVERIPTEQLIWSLFVNTQIKGQFGIKNDSIRHYIANQTHTTGSNYEFPIIDLKGKSKFGNLLQSLRVRAKSNPQLAYKRKYTVKHQLIETLPHLNSLNGSR